MRKPMVSSFEMPTTTSKPSAFVSPPRLTATKLKGCLSLCRNAISMPLFGPEAARSWRSFSRVATRAASFSAAVCADAAPAHAVPALAVAREHLGRDEERLQQRARGEASRERAEESGRAGRVGGPPDIL